MTSGWRNRWDVLAATAAAVGLIMIGVYLSLIAAQDGQIAVWFLAGLIAAVVLSLYGAFRAMPWRSWALAVAGVMMAGMGLVSILSIGFPILCAGVLALVAAIRGSGYARHARAEH